MGGITEKDKTSIKMKLRILLELLFICFFLSHCQKKISQGKTEVFEVASSDMKSKIYIKRKVWGVTSDYQVTVISNSPDEIGQLDSTIDFVYKGLEPFIYRIQSDTLVIYTMLPTSEPRDFDSSKIRVIQKKVSNQEYMKLIYKINKGEIGLGKI
jgi:hypothetical protein